MTPQTRHAWAVDSRSHEGHGLIGFGFLPEWKWERPAQFSGYRTALFSTREQAREVAKKIRAGSGFKNARACRVAVTIEVAP